MTVNDTGNPDHSGTESGITVTPAAATQLVVAGAAGGTADTAETLTVTAEDPYGNIDPSYTGTVHFTSSDVQAVLPADSSLTKGTGTFNFTLKTAGAQSVTATDSKLSGVTGTETGVMVTPAAATHLVVAGAAGGTADTAETLTVTAEDPYGNIDPSYTGTVHFSSSDVQAVLPADSSLTKGTGTFNFTLKSAGMQSITATDTATGTITGTETGVAVTPTGATHFTVSSLSGDAAGTVLTVTVTALDPYGNIDPSYTGTVHFASSDGQAVLPADSSLTKGTGTFSITLETAGAQSVTVNDTGNPDHSGTESGITVTPAAATHLVVAGAAGGTADTAETLTVTAEDPYGNIDPSYTGTVHFSSSDVQAVLPADSSLTKGTGTFNFTLKSAGTQSITATDTATGTITGTETGVAVTPTGATHFTVSSLSGDAAGTVLTVTVTADGPLRQHRSQLHRHGPLHQQRRAGRPPRRLLPDQRHRHVQHHARDRRRQSVTVNDTGNPDHSGTESGITVTPAAATHLVVAGAAGGTADTAETLTVTAEDPYGNIDPSYTGTVHFTSSDGQAVLPADSSLTKGTGTFNFTLKTAGTQSITATDTESSATITGTETGVTVTPAAATQLVVTGAAGGTADTAETLTVTAEDPYGNIDPSYTGTVHFSSSDVQAVLPADSSLTKGTGTFSFTLKTAGSQSVTATDTASSATITGTETGVTVTPAAATHLVVAGAAGGTADTAETLTVTAEDPYGNIDPSYTGTVHFTSSDGQAVLPADSSLTKGTGTFNFTLKSAGMQSITATDTATGTITGTETGVAVTPTGATHFTVSSLSGDAAGTVLTVTVTALDPYGNIDPSYTGTVHFASSDGQAVLPADSSLTKGTGTFNFTLKTAGAQSVTVNDTGNPDHSGTESGITVTPAAATQLVVAGAAGGTADTAETLTVTAEDPYGNIDPSYTGTVHFTSSDVQAVLPADSSLTKGTGTFNFTLKTAGAQSVTATDSKVSGITGTETGVTVNQASTMTVLTSSDATSVYGELVTFTATVTGSGTPTGTVTFYAGAVNPADQIGTGTLRVVDGQDEATVRTSTLTVSGSPYAITAVYGGDEDDQGSTSNAVSQTITPAPLTVTADDQTKVYGAVLPALTASYTGFVNGDTSASLTTQPTLSTTATAASHVAGSPYAITASGAADTDYTIGYVGGSLTVTTAALTITADDQTKVYGAAMPSLTASYSGFVNGDTSASLTTPPTLSTTATAASHVAGSPYAITASGAADTDYTIGYVGGSLTVTTAALTITADNQTKVYGAALPSLTASYSGFVNGDTSASLTTPPTLSTTATAASHVAGSPYAITASGAEDSDYAISSTAGSLTVTTAALTITADNQTKVYGAACPA